MKTSEKLWVEKCNRPKKEIDQPRVSLEFSQNLQKNTVKQLM